MRLNSWIRVEVKIKTQDYSRATKQDSLSNYRKNCQLQLFSQTRPSIVFLPWKVSPSGSKSAHLNIKMTGIAGIETEDLKLCYKGQRL